MFHPEFIDLTLGSFSPSTIMDIASILFFIALFVIFFSGLYNIHFNLLDIRLSQHYLTIVKENGVLSNDLSNFYINKALPLFRRTSLDSYIHIAETLWENDRKLEEDIGDKPLKLSWFDNVHNTMYQIYKIFDENKIHYLPFFSKDKTFSLVVREYLNSRYLLEFKHHLQLNKLPSSAILYYLGSPPEWKKLSQDQLDKFKTLKQDKPNIWNQMNEEWIEKFHDDIKTLKENLKNIGGQLYRYGEDGKHGRNFFTFIKSFIPFKSRLEKCFNNIRKRVNQKLKKKKILLY